MKPYSVSFDVIVAFSKRTMPVNLSTRIWPQIIQASTVYVSSYKEMSHSNSEYQTSELAKEKCYEYVTPYTTTINACIRM